MACASLTDGWWYCMRCPTACGSKKVGSSSGMRWTILYGADEYLAAASTKRRTKRLRYCGVSFATRSLFAS
jgi:hypothetical protein